MSMPVFWESFREHENVCRDIGNKWNWKL